MAIEVQDGSIMIPGNAAAVEVRRRREENVSLEEQMRVLREKQLENSEIIGSLAGQAVWVPSGDLAPEESDPAPEDPPSEEEEE